MSDRKPQIKYSEFSEEMQKDAQEFVKQALEKFTTENEQAGHIKKEFDKKYQPTWQCIVGRNFSASVAYEAKNFSYFYVGQIAVLIFKIG